VFAARDAVGVDLNLDLTLAPERPVSLRLTQVLKRAALPFSDTNVPIALRDDVRAADYTHYNEYAGAQLLFRSTGGLLLGSVGYKFGYLWFDDIGFAFNNNLTHTATLGGSWEFLPKTALFYDGAFTHQNFTKVDDQSLSATAFTSLHDSNVITSRIGLNGAITSRIGATVAIGYAAGFYDDKNDFEGLIGNVEARYTPSAASEIALVFERNFLQAYQGNFQESERVYSRLRWLFGGEFLLAARGGVEFLTFGEDRTQGNRDDRRYFGDLSGEYRFIDWLAVTAQFGVLVDDTDFAFRSRSASSSIPALDPAKFTSFEIWLGLRAFL
jgi:hypothetical protein